jgi:hypothetical protein
MPGCARVFKLGLIKEIVWQNTVGPDLIQKGKDPAE